MDIALRLSHSPYPARGQVHCLRSPDPVLPAPEGLPPPPSPPSQMFIQTNMLQHISIPQSISGNPPWPSSSPLLPGVIYFSMRLLSPCLSSKPPKGRLWCPVLSLCWAHCTLRGAVLPSDPCRQPAWVLMLFYYPPAG